MKKIFQNISRRLGYEIISISHYNRLQKKWEIPTFDCFQHIKDIIKPEALIFDIGANVGQSTNKFKSYFPKSSVFAFEPVLNTYNALLTNISHLDKVKSYQIALAKESGNFEIYHRENSEWNSLVPNLNKNSGNNSDTKELIETVSLDEFMQKNDIAHIDFLKSDTEGFELSVLQGASSALMNSKIDMLYIEVGFSKEDEQHTYFQEVFDLLEKFNYGFCGIYEVSLGYDLRAYYANALFMSKEQFKKNKEIKSFLHNK